MKENKSGLKSQLSLVAGLVFAIIIAIFAILNVDKVPVSYVFGKAEWPLILVILGSALIGFMISLSFSVVKMYGNKRTVTHLTKTLKHKEELIGKQQAQLKHLEHELKEAKKNISTAQSVTNSDI